MKSYFPVQSTTLLYRIGLLAKQARLRMSLRQIDLAERAGVSLRTVRHIEAGKADGVSLRDFMLTLFFVGVSDRVFQALQEDPTFQTDELEANQDKRVRLVRNRAEDF